MTICLIIIVGFTLWPMMLLAIGIFSFFFFCSFMVLSIKKARFFAEWYFHSNRKWMVSMLTFVSL